MLSVKGSRRPEQLILHRLTSPFTRWIDRWIPPRLLEHRVTALRARVLVGASMFASTAALTIEPIRLAQEPQHWIPLASWTLCTLLFVLNPVLLRVTGRVGVSATVVPLAMLIGSLGVAVKEGGVSSPNAMVMIIGPVVATLLGGALSGAASAVLAVVCSGGLWLMHEAGLIENESPMADMTVVTMRATLLAALSLAIYLLTLFYEAERNRTEARLADEAIELQRARDAIVEATSVKIELLASQQREMERDLQLTAAVQKLLLPKQDSLQAEHASVAGFSVPAQQSGGDWWFAETMLDGRLRVVVGDVTGHGAAPAMVAAVVAGAFRALQATTKLDGDELLEVLHGVLQDVSAGMYTMPFGVLELSPFGTASFYSAAAPPLLVLRRNGVADTITVAGTPLGSDELHIGKRSFELLPGERILLTSDGVPELRMSNGAELGLRRLVKLLETTDERSVTAARDRLAESLDAARGPEALHDDITFALIELHTRREQRASG